QVEASSADQVEASSGNADAGEVAAAPVDNGNAEPVIADIDN
ncbi:DUF4167 domain-containing protein, partial [Mesorhizobium sp. M2D.F.Ca.ET.160.01.1.1]